MVVQNDFLMLGFWMALDMTPGGSESLQPHWSLCLLAGESQPHASPWACSLLGSPATWAGREGGSQARIGRHLGCGRSSSFWLVSDLKVSANLDFRKHHRGPQDPEVAVKAGLCPYKELWFEESRCPVERIWMGRTLKGPDADAQLQTQQIVLCTGVGSLKQHHGGGGRGMNIQTAT